MASWYKLKGEAYVSRAEYPLQPKAGGRTNKALALYLPNMKLTSVWRTIASEQSLGLQCAPEYGVLKFPYKFFSLIFGILLQNQINY